MTLIFPDSHQHLLLSVILMLDLLVGVKWCLVVFTCVSLMANGVRHLFMYVLVICVPSLEKSLINSFRRFLFVFDVHNKTISCIAF